MEEGVDEIVEEGVEDFVDGIVDASWRRRIALLRIIG